jgi:DNA polymerase-3 subunit alpha
MNSKFTHLHTHSHYSLLSALPKIDELIEKTKEKGMGSLALTDNGNLYGAIEFYKACKKANVKPIIGIDGFMAIRKATDKQAGIDNKRTRLVLLAKNNEGYKNLIRLTTESHTLGFYYKPRMDFEMLEKYNDGLIAIIPSFSGDIISSLRYDDEDKALEKLKKYQKIFGENLYFEITHHPEIDGHEENIKKIIAFGKKQKIPLVACHDVYYLNPEDRKARETLVAVNNQTDFAEREKNEADFSFVGEEEIKKWFKNEPEAVENTQKIAEMCNVSLDLGKWVFPAYKTTNGISPDDELKRLTYEGIKSRNVENTEELIKRVDYELEVIKNKGYSPYFLVVSDLLRHAKEVGILSTTRGSAGGSMVSYLTYITTVNPIEYNLPFERFLNPERPSAPDIDMDIADDRRDEMIEYAKKRYGADKVAQVGTFGTMMARGSVRDVARALGHPYSLGDQIAKLIPLGSQGFPMTIEHAFEIVPELKKLYDSDEAVKEIIDTAKKIEGCARHVSVHAAGVVIAPAPLTDFTPLQYDPKGEGKIITQYDMYSIEEAGLLKFDFLGIKNLSILADAVHRVEVIENKKIDLDNIPIDDKKTYEMLARGETTGVFQLGGDGMTKYLKDLRPTRVDDISVMVALYRPGPMDNIDEYIARKHGQKPVKYLHPKMKSFLDRTFGVLVYQDDLLMTALELAGYSWGEVDKFRKAVGKKIPEEMAKQHKIFVEGCKKHSNITEEKAEEIWKLFEPFQGYGFNKAHAASYGRLAYQTAYMKANFPAIYMSSVLTADSGDVEKIGETIAECKRMGIPVLPPSVNESYSDFSVVRTDLPENDKIRFGLTTIKNFGEGIAKIIIEERKKNGKFKSLSDFLKRVKDRNLNKKSIEALVMSGALDEFGERGQMMANMERILAFVKEEGGKVSDQNSLFFGFQGKTEENVDEFKLDKAEPAKTEDRLAWEKELLGLYISGHPLDKFRDVLEKREVNIKKIKEEMKEGMIAVVGGILEEVRLTITKNNAQMAFAKIADLTGSIDAVFFPKVYEEFKTMIVGESCIAIKGRISNRGGEKSMIVEKVKKLT